MPRDRASGDPAASPAPARGREDAHPQADLSAGGVDLSLIRWMLSLTPAERLAVLQGFVDSVWKLRRDDAP